MQKIMMKLIGLYLNILAILVPRQAGHLGLELFCRPFRRKITDKQKQFLESGKPFTFEHNSETITAYSWGNGEKKVLLLHGWQSHTYRWKAYVEPLVTQGYTVFAFDAPGCGLSSGKFLSVPTYSEVIEKMILHLGRIDTIISHSLGGFSALYTLHRNPSLSSEKLVVMASPGEAAEFFRFYKGTLNLSERSEKLVTQQFINRFHHSPEYFSASKFASTLTIPGLIIHDEEDDDTSANHSQRIHQQWSNSRLVVTKGLGHNLKSTEVIKEVVKFVGETSTLIEPPFSFLNTSASIQRIS